MKKKIIAICMIAAMAATAAIGGTLAYFSDADAQTNTFTTGNVTIDLYEDFGDNEVTSGVALEKLMPATYVDGKRQNNVEKEIYVENTGSEDAYVRIHFAIPTLLDKGAPYFDASANIVHWNFWNYEDGQWNWTPELGEEGAAGYDADSWNYYTEEINGVDYNVYVATYETALAEDKKTPLAVWNVYMDSSVTNSDIAAIVEAIGAEWKILVAAEGTQAAGFPDAYTALNAAFGTPGSYPVDWAAVTAGDKNDTFVDLD